MEAFGVLNLIRSLLESNKTADNSPSPPTEKTDSPSTPMPQETLDTQVENSYLLFTRAHDERAKKLRK